MIGSRLLFLAYLLGCCCVCYGASLRGVDPKLRASYAAVDGRFTCLDGLKAIPFDRVNDDYCDCFDGSDEPGTAACPNGKFYCKNTGFEPLRLNASFVDDGVCDCCDGSDEAAVKCPNTCKEKGAEAIKALKAEVAAAEAGVKAKERYISQAGGIKKGWQQRLSALEGEIDKQQKLVDELAAKRDALQDEERKAEEARKQAEEERKQKEEEEAAARQAAAAAVAGGEEQQAQQAAAGGEAAVEGGQQPQGEDSGSGAAAEPEKEEESAEELAKRVAAQWIPGANREEKPAAAEAQGGEVDGGDGDGVEAAAGQDYAQDFMGEDGDEELAGGSNDEDEEHAGDDDEEEFIPETPSPSAEAPAADEDRPRKQLRPLPQWANKAVKWGKNLLSKVTGKPVSDGADGTTDESSEGSDLDSLRKRLADARSAVTSASGKLRDLNKEKKGLEEALKREYGPQDEFVALADKCFETQVDKYTYEVCLFAKANQKEGHGSTFLGNWGGFGDNHSSLRFKGGMSCWQGPQRSITVSLVCGSSEELSKVEEPSRCEYAAQLTTPAACSGEALQALRARLEAKLKGLDGEESRDEL